MHEIDANSPKLELDFGMKKLQLLFYKYNFLIQENLARALVGQNAGIKSSSDYGFLSTR